MERTACTTLFSKVRMATCLKAISTLFRKEILSSGKTTILDFFSMQENESTQSDSIKPEWAETYTFTLTGEPDEILTFEVFHHNSCEGALQLDYFDIKLREDPTFFELLSDQNFHHFTYNSTMMHPLMHHPSFETENSHQESREKSSANQSSSFKVMLRWRYDEDSIKLS